jgi:hypothetical protein
MNRKLCECDREECEYKVGVGVKDTILSETLHPVRNTTGRRSRGSFLQGVFVVKKTHKLVFM